MIKYNVSTIAAFTHPRQSLNGEVEQIGGNNAGVCLLHEFPRDEADGSNPVMETIARTMGHAETAFLVKQSDNCYAIRWFTPTEEVPLCGHATLAAAHYLRTFLTVERKKQVDEKKPVQFITKESGTLTVQYVDDDTITITLPATPGRELTPEESTALAACVSANDKTHIIATTRSDASILVELNSVDAVKKYTPKFEEISQLNCEDLIVTARGDSAHGADYVYRCFAPKVGINEDLVTGSANCLLAPYWAEKLGTTTMQTQQLSGENGAVGGALGVVLNGAQVALTGQASLENTRDIRMRDTVTSTPTASTKAQAR